MQQDKILCRGRWGGVGVGGAAQWHGISLLTEGTHGERVKPTFKCGPKALGPAFVPNQDGGRHT